MNFVGGLASTLLLLLLLTGASTAAKVPPVRGSVGGPRPIVEDVKIGGGGGEAFSCAGKVIGGYYADVQHNCQMFHVCTVGENGEIRDIVFRCLSGTVFDQETRVCEREEEVDCTQSETFFHLNNDLYGPGIIPENAIAPLRQVQGQTETQNITRDTVTTTETKSMCEGKTRASIQADTTVNCVGFSVCIPQRPHRKVTTRNFYCADAAHAFDHNTGMCSTTAEIECSSTNPPFQISLNDAKIFSVYMLGLCSTIGQGSYIIDSRSGCEQYIQCPGDHSLSVAVHRCSEGFLFSQDLQKCIPANDVVCARDIFSLLKLVELKSSGSLVDNKLKPVGIKSSIVADRGNKFYNSLNSIFRGPEFGRRKRALSFEDRNPHREASSGALTNVAGIFSDHASVIDSQGPGNVVEGKVSIPKFSIKSETVPTPTHDPVNHLEIIFHKDKVNPSVQPETSLEFNKTTLNGATIEVSEIASPDHKGKVTITSIVPKFVRQNGNGHSSRTTSNHIPTTTTAIVSTNGRTKITLVGSNHQFPEAAINEETIVEERSGSAPVDETATEGAVPITEVTTVAVSVESDIKTTTLEEPEEITEETTVMQSDEVSEIALEEKTTILPSLTSLEITTTSEPSSTTTPTTTTTHSTTPSTTTSSTSTTSPEPLTTLEPEGGNVKSNFTCKDKELEQFYPDIEKNCKLFHYCSPGFRDNEVLDLTFVCSNHTRFDVITKKCQDMNTVVCGEPEPKNTTTTTTAASSTPSTSSTTTVSSTESSSILSSTTTTHASIDASTEVSNSGTTTTASSAETSTSSTTKEPSKPSVMDEKRDNTEPQPTPETIDEIVTTQVSKTTLEEKKIVDTSTSLPASESVSTEENVARSETLVSEVAKSEPEQTVSSTTESAKLSSSIPDAMTSEVVQEVSETSEPQEEDTTIIPDTEVTEDINKQIDQELEAESASSSPAPTTSVVNEIPRETVMSSPSTLEGTEENTVDSTVVPSVDELNKSTSDHLSDTEHPIAAAAEIETVTVGYSPT